MVKLNELSRTVRRAFVQDVSLIMAQRYHIDSESINEFWGTVEIGIIARRKA